MDEVTLGMVYLLHEELQEFRAEFRLHDSQAKSIYADTSQLRLCQERNDEFMHAIQGSMVNITASQERTQTQLEQYVTTNTQREQWYQGQIAKGARFEETRAKNKFQTDMKKLALYTAIIAAITASITLLVNYLA
jgi:hypothetical protein